VRKVEKPIEKQIEVVVERVDIELLNKGNKSSCCNIF
jgi:hypothetical protein